MVVVILKRNTAGGDAYLHHLARYLKYDRKTKGIRTDFVDLWGFGVDGADPELAYEQMKRTREYFGKEQYNPLLHYIVSFDLTVQDAFMASVRAEKIAAYFKGNHQVLLDCGKKMENDRIMLMPIRFRFFLLNGLSLAINNIRPAYANPLESSSEKKCLDRQKDELYN